MLIINAQITRIVLPVIFLSTRTIGSPFRLFETYLRYFPCVPFPPPFPCAHNPTSLRGTRIAEASFPYLIITISFLTKTVFYFVSTWLLTRFFFFLCRKSLSEEAFNLGSVDIMKHSFLKMPDYISLLLPFTVCFELHSVLQDVSLLLSLLCSITLLENTGVQISLSIWQIDLDTVCTSC